MSVETLEVITTNYTLEVQNGTTQTLEVVEGTVLELGLSEMGLQGPQGPQGIGDMDKSVYDTNDNGIVDAAESVPWTGVTGKPSTFPPDTHTQAISSITGLQGALDAKEPADGTILKDADIGVTVQAYDADLTAWAGKTSPSGTVVGTSDSQVLSNKELVAPRETKISIAASDIDLSLGSLFTKTITGTTTFTVSNVPASDKVCSFILELTNAGAFTLNLWAAVKWTGGTSPTLTASGVDILGFYTIDAGTTWRGFVLSKDNK